jgi:DNA-binding IclR family transcriptional regulator
VGYAVDNEEYSLGIRCAAGPVMNYLGRVVASLNVSGPVSRIDGAALDHLTTCVREAADRISHGLGFDRPRMENP